jgi:hypothetical protein
MRALLRRVSRERVLPPVLGFVDGILNALALTGAAILHRGGTIDSGLALRVAVFAFVTAAFVLFVAEYAELRTGLVRLGRQLNLLAHGSLAQTQLGRAVLIEAMTDAGIGSAAAFLGALVPLVVAVALPSRSWVAVLVAVLLLGALGVAIARVIGGRSLLWALAMGSGGIVVTAVGVDLRIA